MRAQVTEQLKRTMLYNQAAAIVEEQTETYVAFTEIDEAHETQVATAAALLETAAAEAHGLNVTGAALAEGVRDLMSGLGWNPNQAMKWLWWDVAKGAALRFIRPAGSNATDQR